VRPKLTILVSGMLAGTPGQGGATWALLQYVLGLTRLGHDVYLVEPVATAPDRRVAGYFRRVVAQFGLEGRAALLVSGGQRTLGLAYARLREVAARADVLVNVSGMLADEALLAPIPRRLYLDLDPAFVQLWHSQGIDMRFGGHSHFVTVGRAIGRPECPVPTCGVEWITTPQPVVLERWPPARRIVRGAFTTVANWRGYGSIEHDGVFYGQKAHSLRSLIALPTRSAERFVLALNIHPDERRDLEALAANGWQLLDPARVAGTPEAYRRFVGGSRAELGIAKSGYVAARCGWFSDRSVCYLASGRPVVAQDTGFGRFLPTGQGLFAFATVDDVLAAAEELRRDYDRHARAARALAETCFDSDKVLGRLLQEVGATA
jgi:hypothetical protein